jgi:hypothetical protein
MKKFIPFLLISILLFVTMKAINHVNSKEGSFVKPDSLVSVALNPSISKGIIFRTREEYVSVPSFYPAIHTRLQPSDFKAHCFYNCKLLPVSNGLCFFPAGLSTSVDSKPIYDQYWKRQFIQYL